MKLVTYSVSGADKLGAVLDDSLLDLETALAGQALPGLPSTYSGNSSGLDMLTALAHWEEVFPAFTKAVDSFSQGEEFHQGNSSLIPLSRVALGPPLRNPGKVICVGLNYADHCREQNIEIPKRPILFAKFPTSIIGPGEAISWPAAASQKVDYEAELAIVIGKRARNVSQEDAFGYIAGYTIANDVSARDVQFSDGQWVRGKSFDTFCPTGPYLVTRDEVGDPHQLAIRLSVNGKNMQDSNTNEMIFKVPEIIAFISQTCTLLPGDLICTGTPDGVGVSRDPPVFLQTGDRIQVEIEKLGRLENHVA